MKHKLYLFMLAVFMSMTTGLVYTSCGDDDEITPNDGNGEVTPEGDRTPPDGVEAVDLGLPSGTLWANMNVGANKPEEYGDYFAWGATSRMVSFGQSPYEYSARPSELPTSADAAYVNWGSNWRMPSIEQFDELISSRNTTTKWTVQNGGVAGRKITSKTNGNSIFLPAAGYQWDWSRSEQGYKGFYWSRSLSISEARYLHFYIYGDIHTDADLIRYGFSVRPVRASE